jgi:hypothetical protein
VIWNASAAVTATADLTALVLANSGTSAVIRSWGGGPIMTTVDANPAYDIATVYPEVHQPVPYMIYNYNEVQMFGNGRHGGGLATGTIVLICVLAFLVMVAVVVGVVCCICRRKERVDGIQQEDHRPVPPPYVQSPVYPYPMYAQPSLYPPQEAYHQSDYGPPPPYAQPGYTPPPYPGQVPEYGNKPPPGYAEPPGCG